MKWTNHFFKITDFFIKAGKYEKLLTLTINLIVAGKSVKQWANMVAIYKQKMLPETNNSGSTKKNKLKSPF